MPDQNPAPRKSIDNNDDRIAVIDIGSNSVRLVVFDRLDRTPLTLFNEKQMCGLGRGLAKNGHLNPEGKALAAKTLIRFTSLLSRLGVNTIFATATAALRTADDGAEFAHELRRDTGLDIEVISGEEEARLAAMGVIAGMPDADGIVGDLGGGSLELVSVADQQHHHHTSLPLGPFKFPDSFKNQKEAAEYIRKQFADCDWLQEKRGKRLYAVGGAWRAIAKAHMEQVKHPIHIVHAYAMPYAEAVDFTDLLSKQSRSSLEKMASLSSRRVDVIPHAALLMRVLLEELRPKELSFSSYGLREGLMFDRLDAKQQALDPLLYSCRSIEARNSRFDGSAALFRWTRSLFPGETASEERLRRASCLLSDFCWAEHPDYRAEHAFLRVLRSTMVGITHPERVFLATVLHRRYGGKFDAHAVASHVLDERLHHKAELLGNALRLGQNLCGGAENVLDHMPLILDDKRLILQVPPAFSDLVTDVVERRLNAVARVVGVSPSIQPSTGEAA